VILDEIHHAGDALSWGDAVREAFAPARRRLLLTGTPFRSDANPIPFVSYEPENTAAGTGQRSRADFSYGYADALRDAIVRPVIFLAYSGEMRWRTRAGDEISARLGQPLTKDLTAQALRTALDPNGAWIPNVLVAADTRLSEVRNNLPDAGGLVIASDQEQARAYAKILSQSTGHKPVLVLSDEPGSSRKISKFAASDQRWMVAVRMVSEGVDVPRLAVGVYATNTVTPLFFAQAVGRFVRARKRGETASVFLPSVEPLLQHAANLERERDHVLAANATAEPDELAAANRLESEATEAGEFAALASAADFDRVLFEGGEYGSLAGSDAELDYLGLPGLLEPEQVRDLLRTRQAKLSQQAPTDPSATTTASKFSEVQQLRRELSGLVGAWHHRTETPHGLIHARLRSICGGPPVAAATAAELRQRIAQLREWEATG